jgi:glucan phosphoethanolaminetransferase (alkaline phosphatase superfamily)
MKNLLNISSVGRISVFFEIIMCAVWSLSVFMVNGADAVNEDHISLMLLVTLTIASIVLMKTRKTHLNKAVLWIAILPLLFISYEAASTFLVPYEAQSLQHHSTSQMLFVLNPVR